MARLRKGARIWGNPQSRKIAERVLFKSDADLFAIDPPAMFGRRAPIEIELGAGKGEFIIERAADFPDPWPKERQVKHRLFTPALAANLYRTLQAGAIAYVATDVHDYASEIFPMLESA